VGRFQILRAEKNGTCNAKKRALRWVGGEGLLVIDTPITVSKLFRDSEMKLPECVNQRGSLNERLKVRHTATGQEKRGKSSRFQDQSKETILKEELSRLIQRHGPKACKRSGNCPRNNNKKFAAGEAEEKPVLEVNSQSENNSAVQKNKILHGGQSSTDQKGAKLQYEKTKQKDKKGQPRAQPAKGEGWV